MMFWKRTTRQTELPMERPPDMEAEAQRIAAQLAGREASAADAPGDTRRVDEERASPRSGAGESTRRRLAP